MTQLSRERRLAQAFVKIADTTLENYDVVDLLSTLARECSELLDVEAGGVLIANSAGDLELVASTSEAAEFVEVMQLASGAGPCLDCFHTGQPVTVADIASSGDEWATFRAAAEQAGFRSIHSTPMRMRRRTIGTVYVMSTGLGPLPEDDAALMQALTDVAVVGMLQQNLLRDQDFVAEQLHFALDTRIMVEQAKGVLAYTHKLNMDEAFNSLRDYAREERVTLREVASRVIDRTLDITQITTSA